MAMTYSDGLLILSLSVCTAFVCEGISWLLIYRTSRYRNMRLSIDKTSKKVEGMKEKVTLASGKKRTKKIDRFESSLKSANQQLSYSKFQSTFVVGVTLLVVFGLLSALFEGKAVAKLPFKPMLIVQRASHRGLPGDDMTDCSFAFFYMLCSLCLRPNLQKLLGFAPPRGAGPPNPFALPDPKTK